MRATDYTTRPCNLRPTIEITRGRSRWSTADLVIISLGAFTLGFALAMLAVVLFGGALAAYLP